MFQIFMLAVVISSGQVRTALNTEDQFNTFKECVAAIPSELERLERVLNAAGDQHRVALWCLKTGEKA